MNVVLTVCAWLVAAPPVTYDIGAMDIEGEIRKPSVVFVASPPAELGAHAAPTPWQAALAELRLGAGLALGRAEAHLTRARARLGAARAAADAELAAWERGLAACERGEGPCGAEMPLADLRPALADLDEARRGPGAIVDVRTVGLAAVILLEPGPAEDRARAARELESLLALGVTPGVSTWAHLQLGELAFEGLELARSREHFAAALALDGERGRLGPYLRYRLAWCDFNLGETTRAYEAMKALCRSERASGGMLAREAETEALAIAAELPERLAEHLQFVREVSGAVVDERVLELAERYLDLGHLDAALAALDALPAALELGLEARRQDARARLTRLRR